MKDQNQNNSLGLLGETEVPELPRWEVLSLGGCMAANDQRLAWY